MGFDDQLGDMAQVLGCHNPTYSLMRQGKHTYVFEITCNRVWQVDCFLLRQISLGRILNVQVPKCPEAGKRAFCKLGPESRTFLESNSLTTDYSRGSTLFREGDRSNAIFIMCSGKVKVSATSRDGKTMILRIADAGDVLGMSAALTKGEYEVTAEALEPCRVRVLHLKHPLRYCRTTGMRASEPRMRWRKDYRAAFDEARLIALPASPAGRVARLILDWADDAKKNRSNSLITMSLTHEEVASMTATTRETVTRTLGRFRKEKIISSTALF